MFGSSSHRNTGVGIMFVACQRNHVACLTSITGLQLTHKCRQRLRLSNAPVSLEFDVQIARRAISTVQCSALHHSLVGILTHCHIHLYGHTGIHEVYELVLHYSGAHHSCLTWQQPLCKDVDGRHHAERWMGATIWHLRQQQHQRRQLWDL